MVREADEIQKRFFACIAGLWFAVAASMAFSKVAFDFRDLLNVLFLCFFIATLGALFGNLGWIRLRSLSNLLSGLFLAMVPMVTASYVAMSFTMPLADPLLARMDDAIGFDWPAFVAYVDSERWLAYALEEAYASFLPQILVIPILLLMFGDNRRAHAFIVACGVLTVLSSAVAAFFPAYGTYIHYGYAGGALAHIDTHFAYEFVAHFDAVRAVDAFTVTTRSASGILTFPSVHAGIAFLIIWATWRNGWLRYPFLVLNMLMAVSALSHGAHYLVDILASVPVVALTIVVVSYGMRLGADAGAMAESAEPEPSVAASGAT